MLIKIAWRNVWRNKTRSAVIVVSVIFGLWAGLFTQAYMNGMIEERLRIAIGGEVSHLQMHDPDFKTDYDARYLIRDGEALVQRLADDPAMNAVTGRLISRGMLATAGGSCGIQINGVDPAAEDSVTRLANFIVQGSYFSSVSKNEVVVGQKLLDKMKLRLNSKVVLTMLDKDQNITSGAFRIKGVYRTQNTPHDEANVFVRRSDLANLLGAGNGLHEIAILLHTNDSLQAVAGRLRTGYPQLKTETWMEISPELQLLVSTSGQSLIIYMSIIMLALAFGIINTMLMAILERTREIGMLIALGMKRTQVFFMILLETVFLVLSGAPVGIFLGYLTTAYFGKTGIDMSSYKEVFSSFGFSEIIHPRLNPEDYITIIQLVVITSIVSALIPARKALKLNPSEAIRK